MHNEWVLREWDNPLRRRPSPFRLLFVSDGRLRFNTPEDARAFFPACIETLRQDLPPRYHGLEPVPAAPALGDEGGGVPGRGCAVPEGPAYD